MTSGTSSRSVAIVYHYLAHYREAVFDMLSRTDARHKYMIYADRRSNLPSISTIPPERSRAVDPAASLNWTFIRNRWLTSRILWQSDAVRVALGRDHDVMILLGNMQFLSTWVAAIIGRIRGKRVLMWTHGVLERETGLRGFLRRRFYGLAHGLLLYGHRARDLLKEQGFDPACLYVVYNSLDTAAQLRILRDLEPDAVVRSRRWAGVPDEAPVLISIGRMTHGKELHLLPLALARLRNEGLSPHLILVGDGPARSELVAQVARSGLQDQVHFLGEIYAEAELCPLICAADLCISPGAVGLMAMHALICGTPVITHDRLDAQKPEVEAIEAGLDGAFFRRGDADDLAEVISNWLSTARDPAARRVMRREKLLRHYTAENQRRLIDEAVEGVPAAAFASPVEIGATAHGPAGDAAWR